MRKDKIVFFLIEKNYSGASKIAIWLANKLSLLFNIEFLTLKKTPKYGLDDRVSFTSLNVSSRNKISFYINSVLQLRKYFKGKSCDLIITFMPTETALISFSIKGLHIPFVTSERSDPYFEKSLFGYIGRRKYKEANVVVFQTEQAKFFFSKIKNLNSLIIPNPVLNVGKMAQIDYCDRSNIIAYSGRLYIKQKRQDILIKAMELIHLYKPNFILKIYGDGPDEEKLKRLVKRKKLDNVIEFCGKVDDVLKFIKNAKLFIFSSDYEGIPNSIIEALSVAVPVVSTDCSPGGARCLIQDDFNGYIVERGDYDSLAKKAILALEHGEFLSKNCVSSLSRFNEDLIFEKWINCIEGVLMRK